jgi:hypothetical protein
MIKIEDTRIIRAPIQKVFQLVSRVDAQPHVTGLWLSADLLDRRQNAATVLYKGYFGGIPVESVQRATMHPPQRVEFKQSRGGLKAFQGRYALKSIDGDTELSLQVEADVGITLITEASARRVLHSFVERSLQKIKFLAERDLPRVIRRTVEEAAKSTSATPSTPEADPLGPGHQGAGLPGALPAEPTPPEAGLQTAGLPGTGLPAPAPSAPGPSGSSQSTGRRRRRRRRRRRGQGAGTRDQGPGKPGSTPGTGI